MISVSEMNRLPVETRIAIFRKANVWEWPEELGEKPDGWDDLPDYGPKGTLTRTTIIRPYMRAIAYRIPQQCIYPESHRIYSPDTTTFDCILLSATIGALLGVLIICMLIP